MPDDTHRISALRAVAHPVRLQILSLLTAAELSAAEIARELDLTHANVSYHLKVLAGAGQVVEAGQEKIRGGIAKRYKHPWDHAESGPRATDSDRAGYVRAVADELVRRSARRAAGGGNWDADAEMWVEPAVWEKVTSLVAEASMLLHAEAKPPRTPGTVHVNLTIAAFEMTDPSPGDRHAADSGRKVTGRE